MTRKKMTYDAARDHMMPGDVVAFGGRGSFAELIKFGTRSDVSHVAVVLKTEILGNSSGRYFNLLVESTGSNGVATVRFSDLVRDYEGEIWWLPLNEELRDERFFETAFFDFLFHQVRQGKAYDLPQALRAALDSLDTLHGPGYNRQDFARFFCSELIAAAFEASGLVGGVNASEVTPIELCSWNIYAPAYVHLKGSMRKRIRDFNSLEPGARIRVRREPQR